MLDRVLALAKASAASGGSGAEAGRPFQELLAPFRAVLVAEVQHRCRRFAANVGPHASLDVGRSLDEPLGLLWLPTLEVQFGVYRSLAFPRPDPGGSALYQGFIQACLADGFQALLEPYPGLRSASARLLATWACSPGSTSCWPGSTPGAIRGRCAPPAVCGARATAGWRKCGRSPARTRGRWTGSTTGPASCCAWSMP